MEWIQGKFSPDLNKGIDTVFCFLEPEDYDHFRHWTHRICNCKNRELLKNAEIATLKNIPDCASESCAKIRITYKKAGDAEACFHLRWWFNVYANDQFRPETEAFHRIRNFGYLDWDSAVAPASTQKSRRTFRSKKMSSHLFLQ
eukprot:GHVP01033207.1.p1 GENE.GHVP01033207.1~~GHVP01033207.1.p1  ORF type:complete len:144 (-),score=15.57 GHVP01033207.1:251-682(-)